MTSTVRPAFARPHPAVAQGAVADAPVPPDLTWFDLPFNDCLSGTAREGFDEVLDIPGPEVRRREPAKTLSSLVALQARIHEYAIALHHAEMFDTQWDEISETLKPVITRARQHTKTEYEDALAVKASAEAFFAGFFVASGAIIVPAAHRALVANPSL